MHHFHNGTLWADDLYMSVPFLCRYGSYKNDPAVLDLAALQFEGFKKYLYLEDKRLMAHVYDFDRGMNTGVPWGRGNGWTIFSLTELFTVLPPDHPQRPFLLDFFRSLAAGCLACQDENGMWHQVLDMPSSYIETSCTAMFICAFCRGIRYGWFAAETAPYRRSAEKAWQALEQYAIDKDGNVHGVCRGSEFSFNPRYYAEHLLPRLNDTHGIGIVLLAGIELLKLAHNKGETRNES
jgi:rhamnogalacturonyl hydrolase YesR